MTREDRRTLRTDTRTTIERAVDTIERAAQQEARSAWRQQRDLAARYGNGRDRGERGVAGFRSSYN